MTISGFSLIRNGEKLGYPYLESIQSVLPVCDEFVIAVGDSTDGTREKIESLQSPKIKIIDTVWDDTLREGGAILAQQTDIAFQHIKGDWAIYIQGDEVIHEKYLPAIVSAMEKYNNNSEVEGLLFPYKHFYGSYSFVGASRQWYRYEIRALKNNKEVRSYRDAQGFRKNGKKLKVKKISAEIYHYGWCRPPAQQQLKQSAFQRLYHNDAWVAENVAEATEYDYQTFQKLVPFTDEHPAVMKARVEKSNWKFSYDPSKVKISLKDRFILWVEKLTGKRLWEYKNYKLI